MKTNKNKALIFTDIHWGKGINDPKYISIAKNTIDFIINTGKSHNCDTCIFCGDWFHSRNSILVETSDTSYIYLKKLSQAFSNVYLIVGNHDTFLKHSVSIHSLRPFENIVNVIDKSEIINISGKKILLQPWGFDFKNSKEYCDYAFGHFEPNCTEMTSGISSGASYDLNDLSKVAKFVFSGHFHKRKRYELPIGYVQMVGSPYEQDWGEINSKHGCDIIDFSTDEVIFVENETAPKHKNIFWSDILAKKYPKRDELTNNFINLVVDSEYDFEKIIQLKKKLLEALPIDLSDEYVYNGGIELNNTEINTTKVEELSSKLDYILQWLNTKIEIPENIDKNLLLSMATLIYNESEKELLGEELND